MTVENGYHLNSVSTTQHDLTLDVAGNLLGIQIAVSGSGSDRITSVVLDPGGNDESATQLQIGDDGGIIFGSTWYIINPTSGSSLTLRVTTEITSVYVAVSVLDMSSMDTTSISDGYDIDTGTSDTPDCIFSTAEDGSHVHSVFLSAANSGAAVDTWSGVTGQTTLNAFDWGGWQVGSAYATQTSSGSITMGYSTTEADDWLACGTAWPIAAAGLTVVLDDLSLVSSTPQIVVSPGEATIVFDELTLVSSPEDITVIAGEATLVLDELTLVSLAEQLTVNSIVSISLDELILASSVENLVVSLGTEFPFSDDFTGSNEDPWNSTKWTTVAG